MIVMPEQCGRLGWESHEPVIPTGTTLLVPVVGIDALSKPMTWAEAMASNEKGLLYRLVPVGAK